MLKLGMVIVTEVDIVTLPLEEFSSKEMKWLEPFQATFSLERKSFQLPVADFAMLSPVKPSTSTVKKTREIDNFNTALTKNDYLKRQH